MMLSVRDICAGYRDGELVLEHVGFSLKAGEVLAILGPNGAGKTTLLRCINGLMNPRQGVVRVDDADVLRLRPHAVARRMGYVAQHNDAGRIKVFDAVLLGRKPHMVWSPSKTDLAKVSGALDRLGLSRLALRYLNELSGGELQKVCIARALVQEPSVLLLDEPTSSLDLKNRIDILTLIRRIVREHRMAAVMTLHDINLGFRFADHLLFLKQGHVFSQAEPDAVQAETVAAVYGVEVDIVEHDSQRVVIPRHPLTPINDTEGT
jgi:iron complex transport system ATP-binding protein